MQSRTKIDVLTKNVKNRCIRSQNFRNICQVYDAKMICWVRKSELSNGLDEKLFFTVKLWLSEEWWFTTVAFPGRQLSWEKWNSLPDK